jgi:hypothetical protein
VVLPDREKMKTQMEALIYHFKIVTEGFRVPEGEVYQVIESPRGELGYYVVSDGTTKPYRVHMRTPSFRQPAGLAVKPIEVNEVVEFYSMLHTQASRQAPHSDLHQHQLPAHGGDELWQHACKKLGIGHKQVTEDGLFSLEEVECLGACSWAPAIQDGYEYHHHVTPEKLDQLD